MIFELASQLVLGVQRVVFHHDRPQAQYGVERDHVLRAVREHERDPVARTYADPPQRLRCPSHLITQLAVGGGGSHEIERRPRPVPARSLT
jgi:hypothetical protein